MTAGARLIPLGPTPAPLKAQVFKLHIALTGLFALHVKLDQHLLNLNGKRVQRIFSTLMYIVKACVRQAQTFMKFASFFNLKI